MKPGETAGGGASASHHRARGTPESGTGGTERAETHPCVSVHGRARGLDVRGDGRIVARPEPDLDEGRGALHGVESAPGRVERLAVAVRLRGLDGAARVAVGGNVAVVADGRAVVGRAVSGGSNSLSLIVRTHPVIARVAGIAQFELVCKVIWLGSMSFVPSSCT